MKRIVGAAPLYSDLVPFRWLCWTRVCKSKLISTACRHYQSNMAKVTDVPPGKELPLILRAEIQRGERLSHTNFKGQSWDMTLRKIAVHHKILLFEAAIKRYIDNRTCNGMLFSNKRKKMFYVLWYRWISNVSCDVIGHILYTFVYMNCPE